MITWNEFKNHISSTSASYFEENKASYYILRSSLGDEQLTSVIEKTSPRNKQQIDYEDNYRSNRQEKIKPLDLNSDNWIFHSHFIQVETSNLGGLKNSNEFGSDLGFATQKIYKTYTDGTKTEVNDQTDADINAVATVVDWMPDYDYWAFYTRIHQRSVPIVDVDTWIVAAPSVSDIYLLTGGANLRSVNSDAGIIIDERRPTLLSYNGGSGSNKIRFIVNYSNNPGTKHHIMIEIRVYKL